MKTRVCGGLVVVGLLLIAANLVASPSSSSRPTNKSLRDYFFARESNFNALVTLANQDKPDRPITPNNISSFDPKFRDLMGKVGARYLYTGSDGGVGVATEDWAFDNIVCGYVWKPKPPPEREIIKSIDELPKPHDAGDKNWHYDRYILLQGNWYIVFQN